MPSCVILYSFVWYKIFHCINILQLIVYDKHLSLFQFFPIINVNCKEHCNYTISITIVQNFLYGIYVRMTLLNHRMCTSSNTYVIPNSFSVCLNQITLLLAMCKNSGCFIPLSKFDIIKQYNFCYSSGYKNFFSFPCWWWTGKLGMLRSMGSQRVGHSWATELTDWLGIKYFLIGFKYVIFKLVVR